MNPKAHYGHFFADDINDQMSENPKKDSNDDDSDRSDCYDDEDNDDTDTDTDCDGDDAQPDYKHQHNYPKGIICKGSEHPLDILRVDTNKHNIKQRAAMEKGVIPKHPSSAIFNGCSGSGKSTLLLNLLLRPEFFGSQGAQKESYFDEVFLFAPTAKSDDMFEKLTDELEIPDENIFLYPREEDLQVILDEQQAEIEEKGIDNAKKILVIFEDIAANAKFMRSKPFLEVFIANRHYNSSTWVCTQSYTRIPRACRLQCNNVFYFKGSYSELDLVSEEYCPPGMDKKRFRAIISDITRPEYSFLFINRHLPFEERYRDRLRNVIKF